MEENTIQFKYFTEGKDGPTVYPYTHEDAVVTENGKTLKENFQTLTTTVTTQATNASQAAQEAQSSVSRSEQLVQDIKDHLDEMESSEGTSVNDLVAATTIAADVASNTAKNAEQDEKLDSLALNVDKAATCVSPSEDSESTSDLDIADEEGNVLAEFNGGHFRTKEFDTRQAATKNDIKEVEAKIHSQEDIDHPIEVTDVENPEDNDDTDLDIADEDGNVLARFSNGHFKTKYFDSNNISKSIDNPLGRGITTSPTNSFYIGEKIDLSENSFSKELVFTEESVSSSGPQGAACFGKYLFQFYNTNDVVSVYDLEKKEKVQDIQLTPVSNYHCNSANFGYEYHTAGDVFPLLYVSQEHARQHLCLVYRVVISGNVFSLNLVQTIKFPEPSDSFMWYTNCMIDKERKKMIVSGLGNYPWSGGVDNIVRYKIFPLNKLSDGDVDLDISDIEDTIELINFPTTQGGFIHNNKIYQVFGMGSTAQLHVIDMLSHKVISSMDLANSGLRIEPEGVFAFGGDIYINFVDGKIYRINL